MEDSSLKEKFTQIYLRGKGIEISTRNFSILSGQKIRSCFYHLDPYKGDSIFSIIDSRLLQLDPNADFISEQKNIHGIYDFCIIDNVIEYLANPIKSLLNCISILKPGGILFISAFGLMKSVDYNSKMLSLEDIISIYHKRLNADDFSKNTTTLVFDLIQGIENTQYQSEEANRSIIFNNELLEEILKFINITVPSLINIKEFDLTHQGSVTEYFYIVERNPKIDEILDLIKQKNKVNPNSISVDVIVPIYNAYEDLLKCLYSLLCYQTVYRILLLDDKSDDQRIRILFSELSPFESEWLKLFQNQINLGFVGTVNKGMSISTRDVVLQNSDTVVTKQWIEKVIACAYSHDQIGTVTPFTNNGTICSIPDFGKSNLLPSNFTIDSFGSLIEKISFMHYYPIPTAVGFSMFIKRELLNQIGLFDDVAFGKGYGEENDFCMRAIHAGYQNVLCDNTFIFHKGEASFTAQKAALSKKNMNVLTNRYPEYIPMVASFCEQNPLINFHTYLRKKIDIWDSIGKMKLMYVLHHLGGGSEKHVMELIENLTNDYVVYIFSIKDEHVVLTEFNNGLSLKYKFPLSYPVACVINSHENYCNILKKILCTFQIQLIHVHHLLGHTLDIFSVAKELGIPIFFTIHDFFSVCPRINLLDDTSTFCHPFNDLKKCTDCLSKDMQISDSFILNWREKFGHAFNLCDFIFFPSQSTREILGTYYPGIYARSCVIEHGHKNNVLNSSHDIQVKPPGLMFHIGYIGVLARLKGRELFYKLAEDPDLTGIVKWSIFGVSDIHSDPGFYPESNITIHGKYGSFEELRSMVTNEGVDLFIFPTHCPETFSYTLSEAVILKTPVLVSNLGALKERVEKYGGGWIIDVTQYESVKRKILDIIDNSEDYMNKKNIISKIALKKIEDVSKTYSVQYEFYINHSKPKYITNNFYSNEELYQSIIMNFRPDSNEVRRDPSLKSVSGVFPEFLAKINHCYYENGFRYTLLRVIIFPFRILHRVLKD